MKVVCLTALAACAIALPAAAQDWANPATYLKNSYVELEGGDVFQGATTEFNSGPGIGSNKGSGHFDNGYFAGGLIGHDLAPGIGVEAEGVYLDNEYDSYTNATQGVFGHTRTYGGLGNLKFSLPFDYHITPRFALVPYAAAGIGYGDVRYHTGAGGTDFLDSDRSGFMWQGKAGVEIKTGTPLSVDVGYRYLETPEYNQRATVAAPDDFRLRSHAQMATVGLRYTF